MNNEIARSPSQTVEWLTCPVKRALTYEMGLRTKILSRGDIAAIGGRGFAKGMEVWNLTHDPDQAIQAGEAELAKNKEELISQGRGPHDRDLSSFYSVETRVTSAIRKYVADDPIPRHGFTIEDVELSLPGHGNARIDLGARDANGALVVIDYKFKARLMAEYRDKEVARYKNSWQQFHYAWAYGEAKGETVSSYYICLVVGEPKFDAKLYEYPIHPESLIAWRESADRVWAQMEWEDQGLAKPWMAAVHEDKFGPCPYMDACFTYRWDQNLMTQRDYVIVAKDEIS